MALSLSYTERYASPSLRSRITCLPPSGAAVVVRSKPSVAYARTMPSMASGVVRASAIWTLEQVFPMGIQEHVGRPFTAGGAAGAEAPAYTYFATLSK